MKRSILVLLAAILVFACQTKSPTTQNNDKNSFSFVFMTDIHLQPEERAVEGLSQAIDTINNLNPDFVITGGDNIMDALGVSFERSDSLYNLYEQTIKSLAMPIYHSMGNHEIFGLYPESGVEANHEEFGKKMYNNRLSKNYYSFQHKNWQFIVIDGIGITEDNHYYGFVDSTEIKWLENELRVVGHDKPVAIVTHIPLLSVGRQIMGGPTEAFNEGSIITNSHEVREILENYNVKIVLQGHLHFLEDVNYNGIHYITGGAVSSNWWRGQRYGMEEGFVMVNVNGEDFNWEYIDFGWEVD